MKVIEVLAVGAFSVAGAAAMLGVSARSASAAETSVSVSQYCAANVSSGTLGPSYATNINNRWDGWRCEPGTGSSGST